MRRLFLAAAISAGPFGSLAAPASAGGLHGPSAQQTQCLADGGSFSAGYDADTHVCVQLGTIQTCRFGGNDAACDTQQGPGRKRGDRAGVPVASQRPPGAPRFF